MIEKAKVKDYTNYNLLSKGKIFVADGKEFIKMKDAVRTLNLSHEKLRKLARKYPDRYYYKKAV